jgi:hypothetical protein
MKKNASYADAKIIKYLDALNTGQKTVTVTKIPSLFRLACLAGRDIK